MVTHVVLAGTTKENHSSYAVPQELDGEPVVAWYKVVEYGEEQLVTGVNEYGFEQRSLVGCANTFVEIRIKIIIRTLVAIFIKQDFG